MDSAFPGKLTINAWIMEKLAYNAKYFGFDPSENYPEIVASPRDSEWRKRTWLLSAGEGCH